MCLLPNSPQYKVFEEGDWPSQQLEASLCIYYPTEMPHNGEEGISQKEIKMLLGSGDEYCVDTNLQISTNIPFSSLF